MSDFPQPSPDVTARLRAGLVIPAHPLALTAARHLDERSQRALTRYYLAAGAGGLAVGVHTTQFAIREAGLYQPVLELAAETAAGRAVLVAGVCGRGFQATAEAELARGLGYDLALLSLAALRDADDEALLAHCRLVARVLPLVGFYLQPAAGGRLLGYDFWRRFAEIPNVAAIKVAPFNRYQTFDVVRSVAAAGRAGEIALYTGNDDTIVTDLLTEYRVDGTIQRFVGGLLGHWAVATRRAVELHATCRGGAVTPELLTLAAQVTDANAALFDAAHGFAGCNPGILEALRRQGLVQGAWCLDERETLSPGQADELTRVHDAYPWLQDDAFVSAGRDEWLR